MKIKRLKSIRILSTKFSITWKTKGGGSFNYKNREIVIGGANDDDILEILIHELTEIATVEMNIRLDRPDADDYIFVLDHRQFTTMIGIVSGALGQFFVNQKPATKGNKSNEH